MRGTLEERFWAKVDKRGPDECWIWNGYRNRDGYGIIGSGGDHGPLIKTHRVAWVLTNGPIPDGLCVLHKCDVPSCCNTRHLFLGTQADNNSDMRIKGRGRNNNKRGQWSHLSKLNIEQVNLLLALWRTGMFSQRTIAATIGTTESNASLIINGHHWNCEGVVR